MVGDSGGGPVMNSGEGRTNWVGEELEELQEEEGKRMVWKRRHGDGSLYSRSEGVAVLMVTIIGEVLSMARRGK